MTKSKSRPIQHRIEKGLKAIRKKAGQERLPGILGEQINEILDRKVAKRSLKRICNLSEDFKGFRETSYALRIFRKYLRALGVGHD